MSSDSYFGVPGSNHINPVEWEEHAKIGSVSAKKVFLVGSSGEVVDVNQDGQLLVTTETSGDPNDMFGQLVVASRYNQIEVNFNGTDPDSITGVTITKVNGGDASSANGQAVFETGTNTSGEIKCVTTQTITYEPHYEIYSAFTAVFTTGIANSFQRIGNYNDTNGFFIGFEGTAFGITKRTSGVDTRIDQASFNLDTLTGDADSRFTRAGTPEALDVTKDNLYRIRYGWLGAAPIVFEVLSPDGAWVPFHKILHPNSATVPTLTSTVLPMTLHAKKTTAGATNIVMNTACWSAGTTTDLQKLNATISDSTLVKPVRAVLTAKKPDNSYTNIDATAGGNLKMSLEDVDGTPLDLLQGIAGFTLEAYDYISLGYTGDNVTTVTYKSGGSGGTTIATLTLGYDGNNNLTSVTKA